MVEIRQADVVVHRRLVDSDDLHFASENHGLDEPCSLFHARFLKQQLEFSVLFRGQLDAVTEYSRVSFRLPARASPCPSFTIFFHTH